MTVSVQGVELVGDDHLDLAARGRLVELEAVSGAARNFGRRWTT